MVERGKCVGLPTTLGSGHEKSLSKNSKGEGEEMVLLLVGNVVIVLMLLGLESFPGALDSSFPVSLTLCYSLLTFYC
jgi:hypothetical protein